MNELSATNARYASPQAFRARITNLRANKEWSGRGGALGRAQRGNRHFVTCRGQALSAIGEKNLEPPAKTEARTCDRGSTFADYTAGITTGVPVHLRTHIYTHPPNRPRGEPPARDTAGAPRTGGDTRHSKRSTAWRFPPLTRHPFSPRGAPSRDNKGALKTSAIQGPRQVPSKFLVRKGSP